MTTKVKTRRVRGYLADGSFVLIPKEYADVFVGIDQYYNPIVKTNYVGEMQAISNCCGAYGKGVEGGVACRSCFNYCEGLGYDLAYSNIMIRAKGKQIV